MNQQGTHLPAETGSGRVFDAMGVVAKLTKRISAASQNDLLAAAERELGELRAAIERCHAEAERLAVNWRHAESQDAAEQFDRQRREALRLIERDTARIPEFEARLVRAREEKQREALARHRTLIAAHVPKLVKAVEIAAQVQVEAIKLREAAVAELGENVVAGTISHLAFRGLLLPDLVQLWRHEVERMFAPPPTAAAPRPVAVPAPAKASARKPPIAASPAPPPVRPLRQDSTPLEGQAAIVFLRPGAELPDGTTARIGDRCNLPVEQARALVNTGAADYAPTETR